MSMIGASREFKIKNANEEHAGTHSVPKQLPEQELLVQTLCNHPGKLHPFEGVNRSPHERQFVIDGNVPIVISQDDLAIGPEIGNGHFKQVHRGHDKHGSIVVLHFKSESADSKIKELELLLHLASEEGHRFIPDIYGICNGPDYVRVVQELAAHGSLKSALQDANLEQHLTTAHGLYCSVQLARGLAFLESRSVVHCDLACRNILLCRLDEIASEVVVKISDFGLSFQLEDGEESKCIKQTKAIRWCSPETVSQKQWSHKSDVWSLGATLWELFSRAVHPWSTLHKRAEVKEMLRKLAKEVGIGKSPFELSVYFPSPKDFPSGAHAAILSCMHADQAERPLAVEVGLAFEAILQQPPDVRDGYI